MNIIYIIWEIGSQFKCLQALRNIVLYYVWFINFDQMLLKWTQDQDQQLSRIIRRHGTSDWALIRKYFKSNRSRDSVIKRWHGKLKFEKPPPIQINEKTKKIANDRKKETAPKRIRVNRKSHGTTTRRDHRMTANITRNSRSRFQRLRNFVEGTKGERTKKVEHHQEEKVVSKDKKCEPVEGLAESQYFQWTKSEDDKLVSLVLHQGITGWERLSHEMRCSQKQAIKRWQTAIYNTIKLDDKVGGFHKYSVQEDSILSIGYRNGLDWKQIMSFLPGRTEFSIQARWRRLLRPELEVQLSKNKHYIYREFLKKIIEKKRGEKMLVEEPHSNEYQPPKGL